MSFWSVGRIAGRKMGEEDFTVSGSDAGAVSAGGCPDVFFVAHPLFKP